MKRTDRTVCVFVSFVHLFLSGIRLGEILGSSGVSAASGLLGKPGTQLGPKVPLPKPEKSADLAHYFWE